MKQIYYMFLLLIFLFGCSKLVDDNVIPPFETPEDLVYSMVEGAIKNQETIVFERIEILLSKELEIEEYVYIIYNHDEVEHTYALSLVNCETIGQDDCLVETLEEFSPQLIQSKDYVAFSLPLKAKDSEGISKISFELKDEEGSTYIESLIVEII